MAGAAHANNAFAGLPANVQQAVLAANIKLGDLAANSKQAATAATVQRASIAANAKAQQASLNASLKQAVLAANVKLATSPQFAALSSKTQQALISANTQLAGGGKGAPGTGAGNTHNAINAALGGSVTGVLSSFGPLGVTAAVLVGTFSSLASAASPQRWATLSASVEGLQIAMGTKLLPYIDEVAAAFQNATIAVEKFNKFVENSSSEHEQPKGFWGGIKEVVGSAHKVLNGTWSIALVSYLSHAAAGKDAVTPETMKKSYAGLPHSQYSSFSDYIDRLDVAGLKSNSKEAENMQKQLENSGLTAINTGELVKIMSQYARNNPPPFRN